MIHFLKIVIQEKSTGDYRSFLQWADSSIMRMFEIRGYGDTPGKAADDAYARFIEDRDWYSEDEWEWE